MKRFGMMLLSLMILGSAGMSLPGCSQFTPENREKLKKELCPKLNDCKLDDAAKKKLEKLVK